MSSEKKKKAFSPSAEAGRRTFSSGNGGNFFSRFCFFVKKHPDLTFGILACAGLLFRLIVSFELLKNDPAVSSPMRESDMATYIDIARNILQGKLPETFYYQPFYYTVFLPLCYLIPSAGAVVTALLQSLLGGAVIYLAGKSAMRIAGSLAGVFASLLAAFSAILVYFTPYALLEILQAFFILLLFYLTVLSLSKPDWKKFLFTGLVLGCSMLTRGNTLFLLPVILTALFLRKNILFPLKKKFLYAGILLFFTILPQLPFAAYNTYKTAQLSGPSTAGGAVLALGNNPEAAPAGLEIPHTPSWQEWMNKEKRISIPQQIFRYILREPGAFLELKCKQFLLFWGAEDHPNNISEEYNALKSPFYRSFPFLPTGVIVALTLAGLFAGFFCRYYMRRKEFMLLGAFIFLYALSVTAFYILARFRLPVLPLLCIASGVFIARILGIHTLQKALRYLLFLAAGIFITYGAYPLYSYVYEPLLMKKLLPRGTVVELENPHFPDAAHKNWNLSIMDASSMFQGGWGAVPIKEGLEIKKEFSLKEGIKDFSKASLVLSVTGDQGSFTVEVNGKSYFITPQKVHKTAIAQIPLPDVPFTVSEEKDTPSIFFTLRFSRVEGNHMVFFDYRRDYSRSFLEGKVVPCELALRLLLPLQKK